jgi:hypothetical protein
MIHPLRCVPALALTAIVGMLALPGSTPIRFDQPRSVQGDDLPVPVGTTGVLGPVWSPSRFTPFHTASDDAGRRYVLETAGPAVSLTRWSDPDGRRAAVDYSGVRLPTSQLGDARPSLVAHGNGRVFYLVREASAMAHPLSLGSGSGYGAGQSVVYASYDGGQTFDPSGYTLKGSGRCGGAADHAPLSPNVYVVCTSATTPGTVWAYASSDDGHSFERHPAGTYSGSDPSTSWPTVAVAPDGTVWALHVDGAESGTRRAAGNVIRLFRSRNHGRTWTSEDITPLPGRYESASMALSPDGRRFGLGVYFKSSPASPWRVYGAVWIPGTLPRLVSLDERHPAEPGETAGIFESNGRLSVAWTRKGSSGREIFVARSN